MNRRAIEHAIARCESEISEALKLSKQDMGQAGNIGVLLWEMDQRAERDLLLIELAQLEACERAAA